MIKEKYKSIGIVGNETMSGIYSVNHAIGDTSGIGIHHLYVNDFIEDLIHCCTSMLKIESDLYYGNAVDRNDTHSNMLKNIKSENENGYKYCDEFEIEKYNIIKKDVVYGYGKNTIVVECIVQNNCNKEIELELEVLAYAMSRKFMNIQLINYDDNLSYFKINNKYVGIVTNGANIHYIYQESPTEFACILNNKIIENKIKKENIVCDGKVACAIGKKIKLNKGESYKNQFAIIGASSLESLIEDYNNSNIENELLAQQYWNELYKNIDDRFTDEEKKYIKANLSCIKNAELNGYVPADLTGHYYHNGLPCYYARDSIMVARAFMLSSNYEEAKRIIQYLATRERKENGEFYQRYDGNGNPNEGANNDVNHQIDSIGYFINIVLEYYKRTNEIIVEEKLLEQLVEVIENSENKKGLVGAEGGVNEGVYGPAFITSSNMFIAGGLKSGIELFNILGNEVMARKCADMYEKIKMGIENTFNETLGRYDYGYVLYTDELIHKYDTPQYFGLLYGFEDTENMRKTHKYLIENAKFFGDGIGYSEQGYHHGPWLFNTLACSEYSYMIGDYDEYNKKYKWAMEHSNGYLLLPEAINAADENICHINPLTWACAEFVSASFVRKVV